MSGLAYFINLMRLTYTAIKEQYLRNIGMEGSTDTTILADFDANLGARYQLILSSLKNYSTQVSKTLSTAIGTQYYSYPNGVNKVDDVVVKIGSVQYPLTTIYAQHTWDLLNAIQIQPSATPQFIFPRRDDFGIWPIPQGVYTITFNHYLKDRNLSVDDYTGGMVTCTNGDETVVGTGTVFTQAMVGRWLTITDKATPGQGYWYRIASVTDSTHLELEKKWQNQTISAAVSYKIGECPEIPEEGHIILVDGVTADFYSGPRADVEKATWFNNKFWTGDGNNPNREIGGDRILGGLIGMINRYSERDNSHLIRRKPKIYPPEFKVWATTIT
jgi:hypothetical protein